MERLGSRLYGAKLASTREVEVRGAAVAAGPPRHGPWLINRVHLHPGEGSRGLLAARVADDLPATAAALSAGEITPAAVAVIADTDAELRKFATAAQRSDAEAALAEHARTLPVRGLQHAAPAPAEPAGSRPGPAAGQGGGGAGGAARVPAGAEPRRVPARAGTWTRKPPRCCGPHWTRWQNPVPPPTGNGTRAVRPSGSGTRGRVGRAGPALRGPADPGRSARPAGGDHRAVRPGDPPRRRGRGCRAGAGRVGSGRRCSTVRGWLRWTRVCRSARTQCAGEGMNARSS